MANYQSAVFYPLNWLIIPFYLINSIKGLATGFTFLLVIHLIIAAIGMSFVIKKLERSEAAQFTGGLLWILGGYIISRFSFISMVWSFAWLSWTIYGVLGIKEERYGNTLKRILIFVIPLSLQLLSGHAQSSVYSLGLAVILFLFPFSIPRPLLVKKFLQFFGAILLSFGLTALQLFPTLEYLLQSQRSNDVGYDYAVNFSMWPQRAYSILFGNLWGNPGLNKFFGGGTYWEDHIYFGIIPILLITILIIQVLRKKDELFTRKDHQLIFLMEVLALLGYLLALGKNFFLFPLLYKILFIIRLFQAPSRFLLIYSFAIVILSAYGLDYCLENKLNIKKVGLITATSLAVILSALIAPRLKFDFPGQILTSILWGGITMLIFSVLLILLNYSQTKWRNICLLILLICMIADVGITNFPYGQFIDAGFYADSLNKMAESSENGPIYIDTKSEEFLKFNRYFRFDRIQLMDDPHNLFPNFLPDTNLFPPRFTMVNNFDPFVPKQFDEFMTWLQQKNSEEQKLILNSFGATARISLDPNSFVGYKIENWQPNEIVQWYDCAVSLPADEILDSILYNESIKSSNRCIFLDESRNHTTTAENEGAIQISTDTQGIDQSKLVIKYSADKDGWIVIRQSWYPGWKALLDGEPFVQLEKVDFLFQGINVPAGSHTLIVQYQPFSYIFGVIVSGSAVLLIIALFLVPYLLRKRHQLQE